MFAEKIRNFLYSRDKASQIPLIVHEAANGNFAPFLSQAIGPSIPDTIADGLYLCVTCAEDVPFIDQAEAAKLNADNPFGNYRVAQQTRACGIWPRGEIPADFREPVQSNVPALIFSGNFDPVTPPQRGGEVARYLSNSRHVIVPQGGARHRRSDQCGLPRQNRSGVHRKSGPKKSGCELCRSDGGAAVRSEIVMPGNQGYGQRRYFVVISTRVS